MAENLPDVVVTEQMDDLPPSYEDTQTSEAESIIAEMKSKADADKKEMRERLARACTIVCLGCWYKTVWTRS